MARVLIACEESGVVRRAFAALGHDAWSCDLIPAADASPNHLQCDVLTVLNDSWDLMIAHPECTYLANSGVHHLHKPSQTEPVLKGPPRWVAMFEAAKFFNRLIDSGIPRFAIENPIPHGYATALIGRYTQTVQPFQFGDPATKRTCLWLHNLPKLTTTNLVPKEDRKPVCHYMSPGPERKKLRSRTPPGFAAAMAEQWGRLL